MGKRVMPTVQMLNEAANGKEREGVMIEPNDS